MKKQVVLTRKELNEYIDRQANNIIENLLKKKSELSENKKRVKTVERLTNRISESIMQKMGLKKSVKLNESIGNNLFVEIRFVQGDDDDYNEIEQMFCGEQNGYCEANSQPVIDYLQQWDDGENEPTPNKPRIAMGDRRYADKNGDYTLLYNSSVGGCFLLYRPATESEIDWYYDNGPGSMSESKQYISEAGHLYGHDEDGTPFTNSTDTWRGVKGTTFISHGEWSDPEIWYKGKELNASDIEDGLWSWYQEECSENNEQPTEQGYEQWLETQDLASYLDDVLFGMSESKRRNASKYINETIEYDDYGSISEALVQCGWAYSDAYDVHNKKTGQNGIRYIIEPYPNNLEGIKPMDVEEMKQKMTELIGEENVIFSEGQYRIAPEIKKLSMVVLEDEITESKKKTLKESIYEEQWEDEIKMFFHGLNNGKAFVENDFVAVEWGHNQTDSRFIIYEYGDTRLRDDHFSKQHSRYLTDKEIGDIYWALKRFYNVNKDDTMPLIDNYGINAEN